MNLKFTMKGTLSLFAVLVTSLMGWSQTVYTFTAAGATGQNGPTQVMTDAAYLGTNLDGNVTTTAGIQYWIVPTTGSYKIECFGGQGYGAFGGRGAQISGEFNLTAGTQFKILVGQKAPPPVGSTNQYAGGGGSFVTDNTNTPYVIAGGGGGNHSNAFAVSSDASITTSGSAGVAANSGSAGTGGNGGGDASSADGGGGLNGNGQGIGGGQSFINGAVGGAGITSGHGEGGFGCGGGTSSYDNFRAGGGGGYSGGGGAGENGQINAPIAGGGGSFNSGTNPQAIAGIQLGDGLVVITSLQTFPDDTGISGFSGLSAPYCNGSIPVSAIVQNYGNNLVGQVSINWSVNGVIQTPISVTTPLDTIGGAGLSSLTISLGTATVTGPTTIQAWTTSPNGASDTQNFNDSTAISFSPFGVSASTAFNLNCFGESNGLITTSVTNATGPVTYAWSNGSTGSNLGSAPSGTFTVTATNGGCTDTSSATITSPAQIAVTDVTNGVSCFGGTNGSSNLTITGGVPTYSVNWTGFGTGANIINITGGVQSYTVTDLNGCQYQGTVNVPEPADLVVTSVITHSTGTNDGAVDVTTTGGTPGYTYSWSPFNQTTEDISSLNPGTYTVTVTDANGCVKFLGNDVLNVLGLDEESLFSSTISPNPSTGNFTIQTANAPGEIQIEVYDLLGKRIKFVSNATAETTINLNERDGVYLIKVISEDKSFVKRVVLKK